MKQHHSIFPPAASLACALILMLAACTSDALDELPPAGTDPDARRALAHASMVLPVV